MKIEELRQKKRDMENNIFKLVQEFEKETEIQVIKIDLISLYGGAGPVGKAQDIKTEIKL